MELKNLHYLKNQLYILVCALFVLSMQACVDSIPIPNQEVDAKLVFESDISVSKGFTAKITTSADFSDIEAIGHPEDLFVSVKLGPEDDGFTLFYFDECECYADFNRKPVPNQLYILDAYKEDSDIYEPISSTMRLPSNSKVAEMEAIRSTDLDGSTQIQASLRLDDKANTGNFFHILPYRKVTEIFLNSDNEEEERYVYNDNGVHEVEYLELKDFDNNNLYLEPHYTKPGFLVDFKDENVSENPLNLLLHTSTVIDYENQALTKLFFEVRSVTESYYRYELYQSRKLSSLEDGIVEAPISYTNIANGLGYFGGFSTSMDSVLVE